MNENDGLTIAPGYHLVLTPISRLPKLEGARIIGFIFQLKPAADSHSKSELFLTTAVDPETLQQTVERFTIEFNFDLTRISDGSLWKIWEALPGNAGCTLACGVHCRNLSPSQADRACTLYPLAENVPAKCEPCPVHCV